MSRKKTTSEFKPFESRNPADRHVRITESMIRSAAWRDLRGTAAKLYVSMRLRYNGNNHEDIKCSFRFAAKAAAITTVTAQNCIDDLILHGFIEIQTPGIFNGHVSTVYKFSNAWHSWQPGTKGINAKIMKRSVTMAMKSGKCLKSDRPLRLMIQPLIDLKAKLKREMTGSTEL